MPRHTRASSGATTAAAGNPYPSMNASAAAMYANTRMPMQSNDFFLPASSADPMQQMAQQHHQHQQQQHQQQQPMSARSFDNTAYAPGAGQQQQQQQQPVMTPSTPSMPISLPPSHRPSSGAWTPHDDQQLMAARAQGLNWSQIKDAYFPGKTANACRKRHERLAERRDADDWDQRKFQRLAKEYMAMRREIWTGLAQRTGEKWNVVEQKCMTNGLKNLQSASRAASRHDRLQSQSVAAGMVGPLPSGGGGGGGGPLPGYDDDSGISGIALTPVDDLDASFSSPEASSSSGGSAYHHHAHHHGHHHQHHHRAHHQQQHQHQRYPQQLHPDMQFGLPLPPPPGPYLGPYGMPVVAPPVQQQHQQQHHRYSSSVSSSASGYHGSAGSVGGGSSSQGSSPYMPGQRLPSVDMGIGSIMNRSGGL